MSIYITDSDALSKMAVVESAAWAARQCQPSSYSFCSFLDGYRRWLTESRAEGWSWDDWKNYIGLNVIYGEGGWHRWAVREDGEIVLLGWSTQPERAALTREQGFTVWGKVG